MIFKLPWRESASLILASGSSHSLQVLLLQRIAQATYGKSKVFPGGVLDRSDLSSRWATLFEDQPALFEKLRIKDGAEKPPIFSSTNNEDIPKEVGLRICAIRETYEETGILLARSKTNRPPDFSRLVDWRKQIQQDGSRFLDMCKEHNIEPDLSKLRLWSDWLTPIDLPGKRFDTAFFVATCEEGDQEVRIEADEMVCSEWITPDKALVDMATGKSKMPPPQVYEFSRLMNFSTADALLKFARDREKYGCPLTFPVRYLCADGIVSIFPGDDVYPEKPDYYADEPVLKYSGSMKELRKNIQKYHRFESDYKNNVKCVQYTIDLRPRHCNPVSVISDSTFMAKAGISDLQST